MLVGRGPLGTGAAASRQRGFTLIEAMVVIAVMAILVGIGASNFQPIMNASRVRNAALDLSSDFAFARAEAVKRNLEVTLSRNGATWGAGWTISASGVATALRVREALAPSVTTTSALASVVFDGSGRTSNVGTVQICPPASSSLEGRQITVTAAGLARSEKLGC